MQQCAKEGCFSGRTSVHKADKFLMSERVGEFARFVLTGQNRHLIFSIMWIVRFQAVWQFLRDFRDFFPDTDE